MRHVYECPTRWADLDMLGHVNNVVYVDYLQEARVDMMRTLFADRRGDLTEGVVVVAHAVTYLTPLTFGRHSVTVECWVTEVRAATFTLGYEVLHTDDEGNRTVYVRATTTLTPYVFADERPRRIAAEEKALLGRLPGAQRWSPAARDRGGAGATGLTTSRCTCASPTSMRTDTSTT